MNKVATTHSTLTHITQMFRLEGLDCAQYGEADITHFSFSSKDIKKGTLFFALSGENTDGHNYLDEAFQKGAVAAVVRYGKTSKHVVRIEVEDPYMALRVLAVAQRKTCAHVKRIAITGSNGKTTVKELIYAMFRKEYSVYRSRKNFNTIVGIAISCLYLHPTHNFAVFEFGMDKRGEINELCTLFSPDIGVVTNIGTAHIGSVGNFNDIAKEKKDVLLSLPNDGVAIIPETSEYTAFLRKGLCCKVEEFGLKHTKGFLKTDIDLQGNTRLIFQDGELRTSLLGAHNVNNILAAVHTAQICGISFASIKAGVEGFQPIEGRLVLKKGNGCAVIDDTYNASPESMKAALQVLKDLSKQFARSFAILGGMEELGDYSLQAHEEIIELLRAYAFDGGILWGKAYMQSRRHIPGYEHVETLDEVLIATKKLRCGDVVLVKGSRCYKMETIVQKILIGSVKNAA